MPFWKRSFCHITPPFFSLKDKKDKATPQRFTFTDEFITMEFDINAAPDLKIPILQTGESDTMWTRS